MTSCKLWIIILLMLTNLSTQKYTKHNTSCKRELCQQPPCYTHNWPRVKKIFFTSVPTKRTNNSKIEIHSQIKITIIIIMVYSWDNIIKRINQQKIKHPLTPTPSPSATHLQTCAWWLIIELHSSCCKSNTIIVIIHNTYIEPNPTRLAQSTSQFKTRMNITIKTWNMHTPDNPTPTAKRRQTCTSRKHLIIANQIQRASKTGFYWKVWENKWVFNCDLNEEYVCV